MPNIKSAKKRVLVNQKKTEQNKAIRSEVKSEIKKVLNLIKENKLEEAKASLSSAYAVIDAAASKNVIHDNNAANKKAKLAKKIDEALKSESAPKVEETVKAEEVADTPAPAEEAPVKKVKKTATKKTADKAE